MPSSPCSNLAVRSGDVNETLHPMARPSCSLVRATCERSYGGTRTNCVMEHRDVSATDVVEHELQKSQRRVYPLARSGRLIMTAHGTTLRA